MKILCPIRAWGINMLTVKRLDIGANLDEAAKIRTEVFCNEQGFDITREFDGNDNTAWHIMLFDGDMPIATGRILNNGKDSYTLGRIAVLGDCRGKQAGRLLVESLVDYAKDLGAKYIKVGSQTRVVGFYQKLGFVVCGEEYMDEHVPHIPMVLQV
jgi:predicted GNAT family N-acyltransferase